MNDEMKTMGSLLPTLYKDAAQPTVRSAGKAIGSVADLVFNPIGRCAKIASKNISKLLNKFDGEEQNNIVEPETNIAIPILQKLSYTEDDDLVESYTELLKKGCLKDSKDKILPSYANIISSLTPDEVRLIDFFFKGQYVVYLSPGLVPGILPETWAAHEYEKNTLGEFPIAYKSMPFLEVQDQHKSKGGWMTVIRYFTDIADRVNFVHSNNVQLYIDNLEALGIFKIKNDELMVPVEIYKHLEKSTIIENHKMKIEEQGRTMNLTRGTIDFTELGLSFLECCTPKKSSEN